MVLFHKSCSEIKKTPQNYIITGTKTTLIKKLQMLQSHFLRERLPVVLYTLPLWAPAPGGRPGLYLWWPSCSVFYLTAWSSSRMLLFLTIANSPLKIHQMFNLFFSNFMLNFISTCICKSSSYWNHLIFRIKTLPSGHTNDPSPRQLGILRMALSNRVT